MRSLSTSALGAEADHADPRRAGVRTACTWGRSGRRSGGFDVIPPLKSNRASVVTPIAAQLRSQTGAIEWFQATSGQQVSVHSYTPKKSACSGSGTAL